MEGGQHEKEEERKRGVMTFIKGCWSAGWTPIARRPGIADGKGGRRRRGREKREKTSPPPVTPARNPTAYWDTLPKLRLNVKINILNTFGNVFNHKW